jgi:hypothetical protein
LALTVIHDHFRQVLIGIDLLINRNPTRLLKSNQIKSNKVDSVSQTRSAFSSPTLKKDSSMGQRQKRARQIREKFWTKKSRRTDLRDDLSLEDLVGTRIHVHADVQRVLQLLGTTGLRHLHVPVSNKETVSKITSYILYRDEAP